ncbi:M20/M25/M40 family metallo-hydrolase [Draconibacterium sp. IB214405]|uniref:M20/M25/M40 family metallo-hydrolase n=1 Tax=Draconibacterium sp. IB214405 TaxID=3097352 RepID=UPI002A14C099|nr:M20/M25/M40 family metallo-hydrolase [Draconibacterium sp. IB214405]MDX8338455.1 M20/M25/M40 family metallo-hydrolase [Draconibacterium sp. IB214405]
MLIRKTVLVYFSLLAFLYSAHAQSEALSKIDIPDLKEYLTFIASDELQGRSLGTEVDGLEITANYLADYAKKIGLKPAVENYFQPVPILHTAQSTDAFIEVKNKKGKSVYKSEDLVKLDRNAGVFSLENEAVVFIGFGDNIESLNLEGKIVVAAQGSAKTFSDEVSTEWQNRTERDKMNAITAKNPKALLMITSPKDKENKAFKQLQAWMNRPGYSVKSDKITVQPAVVVAKPELADALLGKKGQYEKYLQASASGSKTVTEVSETVSLKIGSEPEELEGKNIVAYIEGSDPVLKNEYIVFMAHYDHLGIGKDGDVYNGADDNGSGTVAIMEVAEAFASLKEKPKRSIVFLWVTCEEKGHFGSSYYCDHPVFPLDKTIASINLDMVGRVYDGPRDDVWKDSPKKVKDFDGLYTLSNDVWPELAKLNAAHCAELGLIPDTSLPKERFLRASDHYHFHKYGVPILNYATGYHADYHKVGDEVEKINFEKIKRVADLCFLVGFDLANLEDVEF